MVQARQGRNQGEGATGAAAPEQNNFFKVHLIETQGCKIHVRLIIIFI